MTVVGEKSNKVRYTIGHPSTQFNTESYTLIRDDISSPEHFVAGAAQQSEDGKETISSNQSPMRPLFGNSFDSPEEVAAAGGLFGTAAGTGFGGLFDSPAAEVKVETVDPALDAEVSQTDVGEEVSFESQTGYSEEKVEEAVRTVLAVLQEAVRGKDQRSVHNQSSAHTRLNWFRQIREKAAEKLGGLDKHRTLIKRIVDMLSDQNNSTRGEESEVEDDAIGSEKQNPAAIIVEHVRENRKEAVAHAQFLRSTCTDGVWSTTRSGGVDAAAVDAALTTALLSDQIDSNRAEPPTSARDNEPAVPTGSTGSTAVECTAADALNGLAQVTLSEVNRKTSGEPLKISREQGLLLIAAATQTSGEPLPTLCSFWYVQAHLLPAVHAATVYLTAEQEYPTDKAVDKAAHALIEHSARVMNCPELRSERRLYHPRELLYGVFGQVHFRVGEYKQAVEYFELLARLTRREDPEMIVHALLHSGEVSLKVLDIDAAAATLARIHAIDVRGAAGSPQTNDAAARVLTSNIYADIYMFEQHLQSQQKIAKELKKSMFKGLWASQYGEGADRLQMITLRNCEMTHQIVQRLVDHLAGNGDDEHPLTEVLWELSSKISDGFFEAQQAASDKLQAALCACMAMVPIEQSIEQRLKRVEHSLSVCFELSRYRPLCSFCDELSESLLAIPQGITELLAGWKSEFQATVPTGKKPSEEKVIDFSNDFTRISLTTQAWMDTVAHILIGVDKENGKDLAASLVLVLGKVKYIA